MKDYHDDPIDRPTDIMRRIAVILVFATAILFSGRVSYADNVCPAFDPKWQFCTQDMDCVAAPDACGVFWGYNRDSVGAAEKWAACLKEHKEAGCRWNPHYSASTTCKNGRCFSYGFPSCRAMSTTSAVSTLWPSLLSICLGMVAFRLYRQYVPLTRKSRFLFLAGLFVLTLAAFEIYKSVSISLFPRPVGRDASLAYVLQQDLIMWMVICATALVMYLPIRWLILKSKKPDRAAAIIFVLLALLTAYSAYVDYLEQHGWGHLQC